MGYEEEKAICGWEKWKKNFFGWTNADGVERVFYVCFSYSILDVCTSAKLIIVCVFVVCDFPIHSFPSHTLRAMRK